MKTWKWRYPRRIYTGFSLLFLISLFFYFQIFKQSNSDDPDTARTKYCDQTIIRKHYMDNKRYLKGIDTS